MGIIAVIAGCAWLVVALVTGVYAREMLARADAVRMNGGIASEIARGLLEMRAESYMTGTALFLALAVLSFAAAAAVFKLNAMQRDRG